MDRVIRLSITGRGVDTDAPTLDDLLDQVRDYFVLLREVEQSLADDGENAIVWRVVSASSNSRPISLDVAPFPRVYAVNIDNRADATIGATAAGLQILQDRAEDPPFFSERALESAERFFARVMNGLSRTDVRHGGDLPTLAVTPENARAAVRHADELLNPPGAKPYRELGSLEGYVQRVEKDGLGRAILRIRARLTGNPVRKLYTYVTHRDQETRAVDRNLSDPHVATPLDQRNHINGAAARRTDAGPLALAASASPSSS